MSGKTNKLDQVRALRGLVFSLTPIIAKIDRAEVAASLLANRPGSAKAVKAARTRNLLAAWDEAVASLGRFDETARGTALSRNIPETT